MSVLVIAEHDNQALASIMSAVVAGACELGPEIVVLVVGYECADVAVQAASLTGVTRVLHVEAAHFAHPLAENIAALIIEQFSRYSHLIAPASSFGRNLMPRVAGLLDVAMVSEVMAIRSPDTFVRPIYAGSALETVQCLDYPCVLTIRPSAFNATALSRIQAPIETFGATPDLGLSRFVSGEHTDSDRPELGSARVVVAGGSGLKSGENFINVLGPLCKILNAALGASRAAVDAGYVPNELQIGQTGRIVAPELYIAVGISGTPQHLAGMKDSRVIVAINKDPDAPIFQIADYGLVADLFEVVPELVKTLEGQEA